MEDLIKEAMEHNNSEYFLKNQNANRPMGNGASIALAVNIMERLRRLCDYTMKNWTLHDLKIAARTNFSTFKSRDVVELMIGHLMLGEQITYDYIPQQTMAYSKWIEKIKS